MMKSAFIMGVRICQYQWPVQNCAISWNTYMIALKHNALKNTADGLKKTVGIPVIQKKVILN